MKIELKDNKGITLITLVMAVIIMLIIASVLIYNANTGNTIKNLNNMYQDIQILSDRVSIYYSQYRKLPVLEKEYSNTNAILDKDVNDNSIYYVIDLPSLENVTLNYGKEYEAYKNGDESVEDIYIMNEQSHTIYYVKGIEVDQKKYNTIPKDSTKVELPSMVEIALQSTEGNVGYVKIRAIDRQKGLKSLQVYLGNTQYQTFDYTKEYTQLKEEELKIPLSFGQDTNVSVQAILQDNTITTSNVLVLTNENTIGSKEDLINFANSVNNGTTFENNVITIVNDIDLEGNTTNQWVPIGSDTNRFLGTLEGNHKKISGIYINTTNGNQAFMMRNDGIIKDLTVAGSIIGGTKSGGMVATNCQIIQGCTNEINVQAKDSYLAGGIAAQNQKNATITACVNKGSIIAMGKDSYGHSFCGGITGESEGNIELCYNTGTITGTQSVGGIAGALYEDTIKNCYNTAKVIGTTNVGGIVGFAHLITGSIKNFVLLENCYNIGTITATIGVGGCIGARDNTNVLIKNNYYLQGTATGGINASDVAGEIEVKTQEELKASASILKEAYQDDKHTINNGYPILNWQ